MMQEVAEKRSEFRFPAVVPVEYFKPDDSGILSYVLDLSRLAQTQKLCDFDALFHERDKT